MCTGMIRYTEEREGHNETFQDNAIAYTTSKHCTSTGHVIELAGTLQPTQVERKACINEILWPASARNFFPPFAWNYFAFPWIPAALQKEKLTLKTPSKK